MIRTATIQDIEQITAIYNDAIMNTTAVYTYEAETVASRMAWFNAKTAPIFVYELEGKVAGYATYGPFRPWPAYQYTVEHSIYVTPQFQRRGVARALLATLLDTAKAEGYHTMVAGIDADNHGSIHLHEQAGFAYAGKLCEVGYKFERWLDLAFYVRKL